MDVVSTIIWSEISLFDDATQFRDSAKDDGDESTLENPLPGSDAANDATPETPRTAHGSVERNVTFSDLELTHAEDAAFHNFRIKLADTLAVQLKIAQAHLRVNNVVSEFKSILLTLYQCSQTNLSSLDHSF